MIRQEPQVSIECDYTITVSIHYPQGAYICVDHYQTVTKNWLSKERKELLLFQWHAMDAFMHHTIVITHTHTHKLAHHN